MMVVKHSICYGFLAAMFSIFGFAAANGQNPPAPAAPSAPDAQNASELAKKTQNPVGDIVSVPLQFNWNGGGAYQDQTFFNLNFQPVIPIHVSKSVTLISRTIVPIDSIPGSNGVSYSGVGDIQEQTFLTPARPGKVIWGLGPSFSLPTATAYPVKTGTWAGGASAVLLATPGPWVLGSLFQQVSPMTDSGGEPKTNFFLWQYFVNYNFGKGWALATAPSITANWDAADGQKWTVPVGGGISRTLVFNKQPMTLGFQYYYNAKHPDNANTTTVRFIIAFIFPQK
jgi:hypothetical protein